MRHFILILLSAVVLFANGQDKRIDINGTSLFVSIVGKGEPVVVLHGGPGLNHSYFKPHLRQLEQSFRVIYYDQRASGQSATPSPDSISIKLFVEDLESLRKKLGIRKLNILAHSWGAVLGVHYANAYPRNIHKMVLANPAMLSREFDQDAARIMKERTTKEDSIKRAEIMHSGPMDVKKYEDFFLLSFKVSTYDPQNLSRLNLNLPPDFAEANKALFTGLMKDPDQNKNLYEDLRKFKFPVLVIHGEADAIPHASIQKLRDNLSNEAYKVFSKSGHFPFVEEADLFNHTVIDFLSNKKSKGN